MSAAPRIALLVHGRLEQDPRVSRHVRAARGVGFRVAVLSVTPGGDTNGSPRWGGQQDGVDIYESRITGRTLLGRLRQRTRHLRSKLFAPTSEPRARPDALATNSPAHSQVSRATAANVPRDLFTIALLLRNNLGLFRQFHGIGARLVHANDLNVLPAGYLLSRAWGVPLLYDSHELWTQLDEDWSPLLRRLFALVEGVLIRRAAAVVTVNGPIADQLAQRYDIRRPVVVMNCPESPEAAAPSDVPSTALLRAIYQGMLNPNRGLAELIDAAALVPEIHLDIRGPGILREELASRVEANGLDTRVHILPPVPMSDLVSALDGYAVGLVPYLPVGMNNLLCSPNKLFEYMAAGLAVVCSDLPVLREVVTLADCGLLYDPWDKASLVAALGRLSRDRVLLARFQANALLAARTRFNAMHEEGQLMHLYDRLTRRNSGFWAPAVPHGGVR